MLEGASRCRLLGCLERFGCPRELAALDQAPGEKCRGDLGRASPSRLACLQRGFEFGDGVEDLPAFE
jgi:hypothetical protein